MLFSKTSHLTPQLDDQIFNDFLYFYDLECRLHRRNQDRSSEVNDNVCENIALLDPSSDRRVLFIRQGIGSRYSQHLVS